MRMDLEWFCQIFGAHLSKMMFYARVFVVMFVHLGWHSSNTTRLNGDKGNPECVQIFRRLPGESCRGQFFFKLQGQATSTWPCFVRGKPTHSVDGSENPIPNHRLDGAKNPVNSWILTTNLNSSPALKHRETPTFHPLFTLPKMRPKASWWVALLSIWIL